MARRVIFLVVCAALAVGACNASLGVSTAVSGQTPLSPTQPSAPPLPVAPPGGNGGGSTPFDVCALLKDSEVAEAMGSSVLHRVLHANAANAGTITSSCEYAGTPGNLVVLTVVRNIGASTAVWGGIWSSMVDSAQNPGSDNPGNFHQMTGENGFCTTAIGFAGPKPAELAESCTVMRPKAIVGALVNQRIPLDYSEALVLVHAAFRRLP
jgi:hypothetical protein